MCPAHKISQQLAIRLILQDIWIRSPLAMTKHIVLRHVPYFGSISCPFGINDALQTMSGCVNRYYHLELSYLTQSFVSIVRARSIILVVVFLLLLDGQRIKYSRSQFVHLRCVLYKFFTINHPFLRDAILELMSTVPFSLLDSTTQIDVKESL